MMNSFQKKALYIPLAILATGSVLFMLFPWDMELADEMHHPEEGWNTDTSGVWKFFYDFGVIPAVLIGLGAFITLMLGVGHPWRKFRKISLYLISCLIVGPGLITNGLLKEFWGRPRPKQVADFGGEFPYEPLLTIDPISTGKSFPCGHATMGFFLFALAFAFLHRGKNWMRWGTIVALVFGGLIGYARLVQGGHFPSDTLWAAGVCWFTSLSLYYAFGLHKAPLLPEAVKGKRPWWLLPGMLTGCVSILLIVSLATPYDKTARLSLPDQEYNQIILEGLGSVDVVRRDGEIELVSQGDGHRFPKSRHKVKWAEKEGVLSLTLYKTGFFTELNMRNTLFIPRDIEVRSEE